MSSLSSNEETPAPLTVDTPPVPQEVDLNALPPGEEAAAVPSEAELPAEVDTSVVAGEVDTNTVPAEGDAASAPPPVTEGDAGEVPHSPHPEGEMPLEAQPIDPAVVEGGKEKEEEEEDEEPSFPTHPHLPPPSPASRFGETRIAKIAVVVDAAVCFGWLLVRLSLRSVVSFSSGLLMMRSPQRMGLIYSQSFLSPPPLQMAERKRKANPVEPRVIDEDLLLAGIEDSDIISAMHKREEASVVEDNPLFIGGESRTFFLSVYFEVTGDDSETGQAAPLEHTSPPVVTPEVFPRVKKMRLSFSGISHISNLATLQNLEVLYLDNNFIDKISNLECLPNLLWLDLSFNQITKIEGLEKVPKLQDLSLFDNLIAEISGLDGCPELTVLSLGRNRIRELRHIEYLRKFKKLRCLCLSGNPMCDSISYRQHVYAYLGQAGQLKYLDYMLVDHSEALAAVETYHVDELAELREREVGSNQKADRDKRKKEQMEILKESFLDSTAELLDELFTGEEETEGFCVRILHGYPVLKEDFKDKVAELIKTLRKEVLEKNSVRTKMMFHFRRAATEGIAESEGEANNLLGSYLKDLKKIFEECDEVDNIDQLERCENRLLELGTTDLEILGKKLMMLEISLQESLQEAIDYFEIAVQDVVRAMSDKGSDFYRALEELEKVCCELRRSMFPRSLNWTVRPFIKICSKLPRQNSSRSPRELTPSWLQRDRSETMVLIGKGTLRAIVVQCVWAKPNCVS
ncbi:leucine rich repeat [Perkinsus olseni]|uniref:Dynein regulatory complex subunit 3 n=1 Tax=Perkinsus olseni TaxID=32597 RepID=A0A7J6M8I6_PEROL|nr:leucine rich repeat [Perkinsus olseni]